MNNDIFKSVSQRGSGEETAENRRIRKVADELHRSCKLYEAQLRVSQDDVNKDKDGDIFIIDAEIAKRNL